MTAIGAIIFDLGRVLVGIDLSRGIFRRLAEGRDEPIETLLPKLVNDPLYADFSTGALGEKDFHRRICERFGLNMSYPQFVDAWCEVLVPMPGMDDVFNEVADRWPVGLLSDTDPIHWNHVLDVYPWLGRIPRPSLSYQIGLLKPDPGCYRAAAEHMDRPAGACLFIDDLEPNVQGARAAGMQALRFEGPANLRQQLIDRSVLVAEAAS